MAARPIRSSCRKRFGKTVSGDRPNRRVRRSRPCGIQSRVGNSIPLAASASSKCFAHSKGASDRGANWLRALAADVSDNGPFQDTLLREFLADRDSDARARYVAFQLLTQNDPGVKADLLKEAESDPSLPIRFLKIQSLIDQAKTGIRSGRNPKATLQKVISFARSPNQLSEAVKLLDERGVKVDLAKRLAMIVDWSIIGPFDNTDSKHFDTAFIVENRYLGLGKPFVSLNAAEQGKKDVEVRWQSITSDDKFGMVDLNAPLKKREGRHRLRVCSIQAP